jgi:hypothetical protein
MPIWNVKSEHYYQTLTIWVRVNPEKIIIFILSNKFVDDALYAQRTNIT